MEATIRFGWALSGSLVELTVGGHAGAWWIDRELATLQRIVAAAGVPPSPQPDIAPGVIHGSAGPELELPAGAEMREFLDRVTSRPDTTEPAGELSSAGELSDSDSEKTLALRGLMRRRRKKRGALSQAELQALTPKVDGSAVVVAIKQGRFFPPGVDTYEKQSAWLNSRTDAHWLFSLDDRTVAAAQKVLWDLWHGGSGGPV